MNGLVRSVARSAASVNAVRGVGTAVLRHYGAAAATSHAPSSAFSLGSALQCAPETKITTLPNGLRVATQTTHQDTATVGVFVDAGSRFETDETNGVANFIEHMIFKGTAGKSQAAFEGEAETLGAELGAYTTRELTAYYARSAAADAGKALSLLGEAVTSPRFDAETMDKEREVILRQMQAMESNHQDVIFDHLHTTGFQGTSLGRTVVGPSRNVHALKRDHLLSYVQNNFVPNRMVVAASGGVSHEELVNAAAQAFGKLSPGTPVAVHPPRFTGSEIRVRDDTMDLAHVGIAFEGVGATHPHFFTLEVARAIVGEWDAGFQYSDSRASPLVGEILSDHVSAVSFRAFNQTYADTGLWGAYFAGGALSIDDVLHEVQAEWMRICLACTEADLIRAKAALKDEILSQSGTTATCNDIGRSVLSYGRAMPAAERVARIDAVTVHDVRTVLTDFVYDKCPAVAAVGCIEAVWDYNRIRSGQYWIRA